MRFLFTLLLTLYTVVAACVPPPNTYDWESQRWAITDVPAGGGTLSANTYRAATTFMLQSKWWGVREKLKRVNLYAGNQTNAMLVPIIYEWTGTVTNDDLIAFTSADYTEATGLTGNTSTKFLRVSKGGGLALNSVANGTNIHLATYVRTGSNEASDCTGVSDAGTGTTFALAVCNGGATYVFMGSATQSAANTNGIGFYLSTRSATTNAATYQSGTNIVTDTTANTVTLPPEAYYVHCINVGGTAVAFTSRTLAGYMLGTHVPPVLVSPYNIAVQNFQRSLGRKVP